MQAHIAAFLFDGQQMHDDCALLTDGKIVAGIVPETAIPEECVVAGAKAEILAPGFVDLQVNGGGGVMFNDSPTMETLETIAQAHLKLGTAAILPTLITETPIQTSAAIEAAVSAISAQVPGIAGLHLEGPHLSVARKGAHDPTLIRPMDQADLEMLVDASRRLPNLMVTVAPETVTPEQISKLVQTGVVVSLGHSDAGYDTCAGAVNAGATCVTHLFNAMSQLGNREPGLVGAAIDIGALNAGLIADGIHVHAASIKTALSAKQGDGEIFLVTDSMAPAGTDLDRFTLSGRQISRCDGRLTLPDGTLAGADLDLATAIRFLVDEVSIPLTTALRMATSGPAGVISRGDLGHLKVGATADFVTLNSDIALQSVWSKGTLVH